MKYFYKNDKMPDTNMQYVFIVYAWRELCITAEVYYFILA